MRIGFFERKAIARSIRAKRKSAAPVFSKVNKPAEEKVPAVSEIIIPEIADEPVKTSRKKKNIIETTNIENNNE